MIRPIPLTAVALAAIALAAAPVPAADRPMSGAEFEAYTEGKTIHFGQDGAAYGVESYLPGRRVVWSFLDGECKDGIWYEDESRICFVYEDDPAPQCWTFWREERGTLRAVFEDGAGGQTLYEAWQDDAPMICKGPDVGV